MTYSLEELQKPKTDLKLFSGNPHSLGTDNTVCLMAPAILQQINLIPEQ